MYGIAFYGPMAGELGESTARWNKLHQSKRETTQAAWALLAGPTVDELAQRALGSPCCLLDQRW